MLPRSVLGSAPMTAKAAQAQAAPDDRLVTGRPSYVVDQKVHVFADRRLRRLRSRATSRRAAIRDSR
jgi:hypothetical protein